jgi:hypothetical protein
MSEQDPKPAMAGKVDREQPWLGLDSFTEETRAFFYGREDEIGELSRRIQRKTLTILFGQSGLGKTSILRAGIVPRLRPEGYCPVYVRISYAAEAPAPAEQIKQAILRATHVLGSWTQAGIADAGESLWEFLHHRDDSLQDGEGRPLIPLLIFDQFEEVFTLAQTDDAGKQRAAAFLAELADLVENRPPQALEARIDADDALAEKFDFARSDYRILLSLREDYLAHLEGLRSSMPAVTQNRMRLARMTGAQALSAVVRPGGKLVSEEVAAAIVRFVAGGAELANAEVEPSLLSLICRELNNNRIAQGRSEISTDLLAGPHASILSEFYQRALEDMPDGVHVVIEDQLLTDAGYRDNLTEERVLAAFAAAGAPPDALPTLVNRRLLRIEERLDVRRVELTHDVLCSVVKAERERRHERVAKEEAQAELERQQIEQRRTRKALLRARQLAAGGLVLAALAAAASVYGYVSTQRAVQTRGEAEKLVGYLLDDFYEELVPVGRLDLVGELGSRAVAYYKGLPEGMRNPETERNRAMALVRLGAVKNQQGVNKEASALLTDAVAVLERAYRDSGGSELSRLDLSQAFAVQARIASMGGDLPLSLRLHQGAAGLLQALADSNNASPAVRRTYATAMARAGWAQMRLDKVAEAVVTLKAARATVATESNLRNDIGGTTAYIHASAWLYEALLHMDAPADDAEDVFKRAMSAAAQVLEHRPGHFQTMYFESLLLGNHSDMALGARRAGTAIQSAEQQLQLQEAMLRVDMKSENAWDSLSISQWYVSNAHWVAGHVRNSIEHIQRAFDIYNDRGASQYQSTNLWIFAPTMALRFAEAGNRAGATRALELARKYQALAFEGKPANFHERLRASVHIDVAQNEIAQVFGETIAASSAAELVDRAQQLVKSLPAGATGEFEGHLLWTAWLADAQASLQAGDYVHAEFAAAQAHAFSPRSDYLGTRRPATADIVHALALAHLGRNDEAQKLVAPLVASHRKLLAEGADDQYVRVDLAAGLLVSALSRPAQRATELKEAQALLASLPPEMQSLKTVELWKARVRDAMRERI